MSKPCEYVVTGALTKCTKGSETSLMKATPCRIRFRGLDACTTCDKTPVINIGPFGTCKVSGEDCIAKIEITEFEDYKQDVRSGGCNFLLAKSKGICSEGGKISFITSGQDISLERLLELLKKLEEAYPELSKEEIVNALTKLGGYGDGQFQKLLGIGPGDDLLPRGDFTQNDLDELRNMLQHGGNEMGAETGIVIDPTGRAVAMGHVLLGILAGLYRNKNKDMAPSYAPPSVGENVDNLYAISIAGDLGKSAVRAKRGEIKKHTGRGSGSTHAELRGDLDSAIIGESLTNKVKEDRISTTWRGNGSLSDFLRMYYTHYSGTRFENAIHFLSTDYIKDQIRKFATDYFYATGDYGYAIGNILGGLFNEVTRGVNGEADAALSAYEDWINSEYAKEKDNKNSSKPGNGIVKDGSC